MWLTYRRRAAERFVRAVSETGSAHDRAYLSPRGYTRRFGASPAQVAVVESWLRRQGFTQVRASVDDTYVAGIPPISDHRRLTVPATLRADVIGVTGRNGTTLTKAAGTADASSTTAGANPHCSRYWGQRTVALSPAYHGIDVATTPVCGYSPQEIRATYGLTSANTGAGETIALIQDGAPIDMFNSLTQWAKRSGLPAPRHDRYRVLTVGGGAADARCTNLGSQEAILDSEVAYAIAPQATQLMVEGDDCDTSSDQTQALFDAMLAPLIGQGARPRASVESMSYITAREKTMPRALLNITTSIALRAAAEGVSLLESSGDSPGVKTGSDDPYITGVGGTTLGLGAQGQRLFETGWSTDTGQRESASVAWHDRGVLVGSGGGISSAFAEPWYQRRAVPRSMDPTGRRAVPDVSALADSNAGMTTGYIASKSNTATRPYVAYSGEGTSMACPLVAGMVLDAEQGQRRSFGFLNPLLYSLAGTQAFHDILPLSAAAPQTDRAVYTSGRDEVDHRLVADDEVFVTDAQDQRGTRQSTAPGYDTTTGLGSPDGSAFIADLRAGR